MGLFSFFGWIFGWIFWFIFGRIDDFFVWILPSYMTVSVIKESKETVYQNYLCFWAILSLLLGIEHFTFYVFYYLTLYRISRLLFVIWLQIDYCQNSVNAFQKIRPYITQDKEEQLQEAFESVTNIIDEQGAAVQGKVSDQFWTFVKQNYELLKKGAFEFLTTASEKAVNLADTNSNINPNANAGEEQKVKVSKKPKVSKKES
eukprot:614849_1